MPPTVRCAQPAAHAPCANSVPRPPALPAYTLTHTTSHAPGSETQPFPGSRPQVQRVPPEGTAKEHWGGGEQQPDDCTVSTPRCQYNSAGLPFLVNVCDKSMQVTHMGFGHDGVWVVWALTRRGRPVACRAPPHPPRLRTFLVAERTVCAEPRGPGHAARRREEPTGWQGACDRNSSWCLAKRTSSSAHALVRPCEPPPHVPYS